MKTNPSLSLCKVIPLEKRGAERLKKVHYYISKLHLVENEKNVQYRAHKKVARICFPFAFWETSSPNTNVSARSKAASVENCLVDVQRGALHSGRNERKKKASAPR